MIVLLLLLALLMVPAALVGAIPLEIFVAIEVWLLVLAIAVGATKRSPLRGAIRMVAAATLGSGAAIAAPPLIQLATAGTVQLEVVNRCGTRMSYSLPFGEDIDIRPGEKTTIELPAVRLSVKLRPGDIDVQTGLGFGVRERVRGLASVTYDGAPIRFGRRQVIDLSDRPRHRLTIRCR